jgi:hypothetical protein
LISPNADDAISRSVGYSANDSVVVGFVVKDSLDRTRRRQTCDLHVTIHRYHPVSTEIHLRQRPALWNIAFKKQ